MNNLPSGTVTFLFTDVESSTQLWEKYPDQMRSVLAEHDAVLRDVITSNHGQIIKTTGDGVHAVFEKAIDAANATLEAQQTFQTSEFFKNSEVSLHVRMGLHTGEAELRGNDYYGQVLNRAARIMAMAHGGQILLASITAEVIREHLPVNASLHDLGDHYLKDLTRPEHLYQLTAPGLRQGFPALQSYNAYQNNLPAQLTSFIGREKEISEIKALLGSARLVTLTGSGGTGKSRLSIEIGRQEHPSFPNGVWLVELAPLTDASQIIPSMAQVFGLQEHPFGPITTMLMDYLRDKKLLLILDNCEHLIEACAKLANDLLHHCAELKILASSREALGIAGEVAYHTPSLGNSESMRLFCERSLAVNPNFHLTEYSASHVTQICSRLDGIPLAIELAAARTKLLSPEQIASRLDNRFRLLVGGSRTALPRQQTLRALIDWSYDLLSEDEKRLFRTASVFIGGWTLDALEEVADDPNTLEHLEQLVNKSLVVTEERETEMRYFMLETIRQYAREKLFEANQSSAVRDRHFVYYDRLSERMWDAFRSTIDQVAWRNIVDDEIENLRSALAWGLDNNLEDALHLAANVCVVAGWISSIREDLPLVETVIARFRSLPPPPDGDTAIQWQRMLARALFAWGMVHMGSGIAGKALQEAIDLSRRAGDRLLLGYSLEMYYTASRFTNLPEAIRAAQEGLAIFTEEINDNWGLGMAYQAMVSIAAQTGNQEEKEKYFRKLKEVMGEAPTSFQAGVFFLGIGLDESFRGNYEIAKSIFENGLNIFKRLRNKGFETIHLSEIGHIARHTGDNIQAKKIYGETLVTWHDLGNRAAIAHQLECFGFLALVDEEPQRAIQLFGAAEALRERANSPMSDYEQNEYSLAVSRAQAMVAEPEFKTLWAEGRNLTRVQAVELAISDS